MAEGRVQRRLAAILVADVAGYGRLMGADETGTLAALQAHREDLINPVTAKHGGRIVKLMGDGALTEFASVVDAVECAVAIQRGIAERNAGIPDERRIEFRMGINLGDIIIDGDDIYGDGVNVAARLEALAEPGGICISGMVYDHVAGKIEAGFDDLGPQTVKNIARPIRTLRVRPPARSDPVTDVSAPVPGFQGRPAIAVLAFDNMSGDPEQEYFADGIADDILTRLAMWRWMPVIARNSSFAYKGKSVDMRRIGRELGARYVLEGSVRKADGRVRVTGQLIDAETGHHVWADRYDRPLDEIFAVQDEITDAIVSALEPAVGEAVMQRTRLKPPASLDAWELHQRGMWHFTRSTKEDYAAARDSFGRAIGIDPSFAGSHSILAIITTIEVLFAWTDDPRGALRDAHMEAENAVALDAMDAWAHVALCFCKMFARQYEGALAAGRRATELNPSLAMGHYIRGGALMLDGQPREAIASMTRAARISAKDPMLHAWLSGLGFAHYMARDYIKAVELTTRSLVEVPHNPAGQRNHACVLAQLGRTEEARAALERFLELSPGFTAEAARRSMPFRDETDAAHFLDGLRKAGLPE
ncbi:MAG: adenylate/guanylate cyclase domain-containing protein [Proteobacteria bacterium]|nr:adenylate/guanylate cyclase domain-containing protein [Pseudomonadota bacterium]